MKRFILQRRKAQQQPRLFQLLNIDPYRKKEIMQQHNSNNNKTLTTALILDELNQNPQSASTKYTFYSHATTGLIRLKITNTWYPLHQAIWLRLDIEIIKAIYDCYPQALKETYHHRSSNSSNININNPPSSPTDYTALHQSIMCDDFFLNDVAHPDVVSFLLREYPQAAQTQDSAGCTPLHYACNCNAPLQVISTLVEHCPEALRTKSSIGYTPLHELLVGGWASVPKVTLLTRLYPHALKEKDAIGLTPLHLAYHFFSVVSLEVLLVLLERWPEVTREKDGIGRVPIDIYRRQRYLDGDVVKVLTFVFQLCGGGNKDEEDTAIETNTAAEMLNFFVLELKWRNGISLLLDRHPSLTTDSSSSGSSMDIDTIVFPHFLSVIGQCCNVKTLWYVVSNKLDIMEWI